MSSGDDLTPSRSRSLALAYALAACAPARSSQPPTVEGLRSELTDSARALPDGHIAWSAHWHLCWDEYPNATAYELQAVTSEGTSPRTRRTPELCFGLEAARGIDVPSSARANRDAQLALTAGQLAYRVRAVMRNGDVTAWSSPVAVGESSGMDQPAVRTVAVKPVRAPR